MLICFKCTAETKGQLDELVAAGGYANYGEVIAAAVANQTLLADRVAEGGVLVFDGDDGAGARVTESDSEPQTRLRSSAANSSPTIPSIFSIEGLADASLDLAPTLKENCDDTSFVPANRWLWGQFNRFLPAKASCRALARLQLESGAWVDLEEAAPRISEAAADLGRYLAAYDEAHDLKRDEATATAFPRVEGPESWKSLLRYANQFVASVDTQGAVSGMLRDLRFIGWEDSREGVRIRLSEAGFQLACYRNPLLDEPLAKHGQRLSDEEIGFFLAHIRQSVRAEDYAYRFILGAIIGGASTPDALDDRVSAANKKAKPAMTSAFVSTQRSGVIARLADLGLIERVRSGLTVSYSVTDRGQRYLSDATIAA